MIELELCGGLGDGILTLHNTWSYESLERMKDDEQATVTIISHNPFVDELFRWHPKASQIKVVKSKHFFINYHHPKERVNAGIPERVPPPTPGRPANPLRFYPSSDDLAVLDRELPKTPFLAVAPTASGMEIENRNIPGYILASVMERCYQRKVPVVFLGRTFQGPHAYKSPPPLPSGDGIMNMTDRLSVPGTFEAVKRAGALLSAHSCLLLLAWYERKPNFLLLPPKYEWHDFSRPSPFGFGKNHPESKRCLFQSYDQVLIDRFLQEYFPS